MNEWLPSHYEEASTYFVDAITFLHEYQWVYNWSVTHILIENAASKIPSEWLAALDGLSESELNELHSGHCEVRKPCKYLIVGFHQLTTNMQHNISYRFIGLHHLKNFCQIVRNSS